MIPNFSKILLVLISFIFFTLYINCGKSVKKAPSELPNKQEKQIDIYSKLDVCGCNKEAIEIIELAREIRDEFEEFRSVNYDYIDEDLKNQFKRFM